LSRLPFAGWLLSWLRIGCGLFLRAYGVTSRHRNCDSDN
jgi:hypothetical protein